MDNTRKFLCMVTDYMVVFRVDLQTKEAVIDDITCDYKNVKALFILLRGAVDKLVDEGITKLKQFTTKKDWNDLLKGKTTWEVETTDNITGVVLLSCDIQDFLTNYAKGLDIF